MCPEVNLFSGLGEARGCSPEGEVHGVEDEEDVAAASDSSRSKWLVKTNGTISEVLPLVSFFNQPQKGHAQKARCILPRDVRALTSFLCQLMGFPYETTKS